MSDFYCFILLLREYLRGGKKNPIPLRVYIHQIAAQLPIEESRTDRRLLDALQVYPVDVWWPEHWGNPPLNRWLFIHDGKFLHREVEAMLEEFVSEHEVDFDTLPCSAIDDILANDAFNGLRRKLKKLWAEESSDQEKIEAAYTRLRSLLAQEPAIDRFKLQRRLADMHYLDVSTIRSNFYVPAQDMAHKLDANKNFTLCSRCGWRDINDAPCIRSRCPGESGWRPVAQKTGLMLLHPEHVKRILIPAKVELLLYDEIRGIVEPEGGTVVLWPAIDRFDIYVSMPKKKIAIDVKDWEHPEQLANSIIGDIPNYTPYPYELGAYVYPSDRGGEYGKIVRERAGGRLSTNRIMSTTSIVNIIKRAVQ